MLAGGWSWLGAIAEARRMVLCRGIDKAGTALLRWGGYGVLWYVVGDRGCREWLAVPPVIDRSSLRDGGMWGGMGFGIEGHRQDACATLAWVETRPGRPCYSGLCGDKDLSGFVDGGGVVFFGLVDGCEGGFAVIGDGDAAEEAGAVAGVAGTGAFLIDAEDERVLVAIGEDFDDFLDVAAFFAFVPEPLAAAAEVDGFAEGEGEAEGFLVHEGDHEDGAGDGVDGDGGDEAIGVEFRGEGGT